MNTPSQGTPALRLITDRARVVTNRPAVLLGGLLARTGLVRAYTLWPSVAAPILVIGASDRRAATWMNQTLRLRSRRLPIDSATWNVARARGLMLRPGRTLVLEAVEEGIGRPVRDPRVAFYGTGGPHPKLHCFVFEGNAAEPIAVAKAMAVQSEGAHLERETENVEIVRERLAASPDVAAALPEPPLAAIWVGGDYVVVEPVDPLARYTGRADREPAMEWLRRFQDGTAAGTEPWGEADDAESRELVETAWGRARPELLAEVKQRMAALAAELRGAEVPRSAVHGDFWRGNMASDGTSMRVFDWEWLALKGAPFFDLWTYDLAELRQEAHYGERDFAAPVSEAVDRVRRELAARGIDERFALLTLAPTIGHLTFRVRTRMGYAGGNEEVSTHVMVGAEQVLLGEGR